MTERAALLTQILTNPEDDTVRLVYADWLEENDEPERAAFIRHQIHLYAINEQRQDRHPLTIAKAHEVEWHHAGPPRHPATCAGDLLRRCGAKWLESLALNTDIDAPTITWGWTRGFVSHWIGTTKMFEYDGRSYRAPKTHPPDHVLAEVFRQHPITYAKVLEFPYRLHWRHEYVVRVNNVEQWNGAYLPHSCERFLSRGRPAGAYEDRAYSCEAEAERDLSDALVGRGRALAGLPDLPGTASRNRKEKAP